MTFRLKLDPKFGDIMCYGQTKSSQQYTGWYAESKVNIYKNRSEFGEGIVQKEYLFACSIENTWKREACTIEWDSNGQTAKDRKNMWKNLEGQNIVEWSLSLELIHEWEEHYWETESDPKLYFPANEL